MARLIGNNIITAPTGMNSKYWEDYVGAAGKTGDVFKGVGDAVNAGEEEFKDYLDRKEKADAAEYEKKWKENEREYIRGKDAEDLALRKAADKRAQDEADRREEQDVDELTAIAERTAYINKALEGKHDPEWDTLEGRTALEKYRKTGDNSGILAIRQSVDNRKAMGVAKSKEDSDKAAEDALKKKEKDISKSFYDLKLGTLTENQITNLDDKSRSSLLNTLNALHQEANENGFTSLVNTIEKEVIRLQGGQEKKESNAEGKRRKEEKKTYEQTLADTFG